MNTTARTLAALVLAVALLGLAGCAADEESGMEVWGYVASADSAQLEAEANQPGGDEIVVSRVLTPEDAWLVVHAEENGAPGERVGLARVRKGESADVRVELEGVTTDNVIVAVHADRGGSGQFDFDMMNKEMSSDRPLFVDGAELAVVVGVR